MMRFLRAALSGRAFRISLYPQGGIFSGVHEAVTCFCDSLSLVVRAATAGSVLGSRPARFPSLLVSEATFQTFETLCNSIRPFSFDRTLFTSIGFYSTNRVGKGFREQ